MFELIIPVKIYTSEDLKPHPFRVLVSNRYWNLTPKNLILRIEILVGLKPHPFRVLVSNRYWNLTPKNSIYKIKFFVGLNASV